MSGRNPRDDALAYLSVLIGTIMEDHAEEGISKLPHDARQRKCRFEMLHEADCDIALLASAAQVLLRRNGT